MSTNDTFDDQPGKNDQGRASPLPADGGPGGEERTIADITQGPLRYYPVKLNGELVGFLWATEADDFAAFTRRMDARHDTLLAAARWSTRMREAANYGFSPLRALRHWVGRPEDPDAGGIAADAAERRAPNLEALERLANPTHERTPTLDPAVPEIRDDGMAYSGEGWRDIDASGYDFLTGGPVRYLPVTRGGVLLGYLWASETDDAADYQPLAMAGEDGVNAGELWLSRLDRSHVEGLTPVQALRRWVGEPEDPVAGGIAADAEERRAPSHEVLRALAGAGDEEREEGPA